MATANAGRRCCACEENVLTKNYCTISWTSATPNDVITKRKAIIHTLEDILPITINTTVLTYLCRKCNRLVDNINANSKELIARRSSFARDLGNTPKKTQTGGREKRMAATTPTTSQSPSRPTSRVAKRTAGRTALSFRPWRSEGVCQSFCRGKFWTSFYCLSFKRRFIGCIN